jgi:hypothetical protein
MVIVQIVVANGFANVICILRFVLMITERQIRYHEAMPTIALIAHDGKKD